MMLGVCFFFLVGLGGGEGAEVLFYRGLTGKRWEDGKGARVQHTKLRLPCSQRLSKPLTLLERGEVGGEGDGGAARGDAGQGVELGAGRRAGGGVARGDVDARTVKHKSLGDHAADALGAACDEDDFVLWGSVSDGCTR